MVRPEDGTDRRESADRTTAEAHHPEPQGTAPEAWTPDSGDKASYFELPNHPGAVLSWDHYRVLSEGSAISDEVIRARGYQTIFRNRQGVERLKAAKIPRSFREPKS